LIAVAKPLFLSKNHSHLPTGGGKQIASFGFEIIVREVGKKAGKLLLDE
jgi:hypothetical protein